MRGGESGPRPAHPQDDPRVLLVSRRSEGAGFPATAAPGRQVVVIEPGLERRTVAVGVEEDEGGEGKGRVFRGAALRFPVSARVVHGPQIAPISEHGR